MDVRNLYTLRYRQGTVGVVTSYLSASSQEKADEVGRWYCNQVPNRRFINTQPAIVASEEDLAPKVEAPAVATAAKKTA